MEALIAWFGEIHWVAVLQIILIDILLGGDNAVVIALACRSLDPHLRVKGIIYGAGGAILLRVILIAFAVSVMKHTVPEVLRRPAAVVDRRQAHCPCR